MGDSEYLSALGCKELEYLVASICFPYQLPHSSTLTASNGTKISLPADLNAYFLCLATSLFSIFPSFPSFSSISPQIAELYRMFSTWYSIQNFNTLDSSRISAAIRSLSPNQAFPLLITSQNAAILISRLSSNENAAAISAFKVCQNNELIMSQTQNLMDLFPNSSYYVKTMDFITSKTFSRHLVELNSTIIEKMSATTRKKGRFNIEDRNVCEDLYVSEWLMAVASADSGPAEEPKPVLKKIRDDVLYKSDKEGPPFRRNPMWNTIKTIMAIRLSHMLGEDKGKVAFKAIMCYILRELCKVSDKLTAEIRLQIIQKLAKRCTKLDKLRNLDEENKVISVCLEDCAAVVTEVKAGIIAETQDIIDKSRKETAEIDYSDISLADIKHENAGFLSEIKRLLSIKQANRNLNISKPDSAKRNVKIEEALDKNYFSTNPFTSSSNLLIKLYDYEELIRYELEDYCQQHRKPEELASILFENLKNYIEICESKYSNKPLHYSRYILTATHLVVALDKIAVKFYPLLINYQCNIPREPFEYLLLPTAADIATL
jgi:hypothetical protein